MKIALIYFSPTGNTAKIASVIKEELLELGAIIKQFDITSFSEREKQINPKEFDSYIFGSPIYAWRAPKIIREWLQTLNGGGKRCSAFFTYGGVSVGVAHQNIKEILIDRNFSLVSAAEFPSKHTYNLAGWYLMENRPDESDYAIAKAYAQETYKRFEENSPHPIKLEGAKISEKTLTRLDKATHLTIAPPSRKGAECSMCLQCENECPTNAMNAETGEADNEKCIRCLRCVSNCPDEALKINDLSKFYELIRDRAHLTPEVLQNRISRFF